MPRINPLRLENADTNTHTTLSGVKANLGKIPNLHATLAHSAIALSSYLHMNDRVSKGRLTPVQREIISLAVGQANACHYCVSAHVFLGKQAGLSAAQINDARRGKAEDDFNRAVAQLAIQIVTQKGALSDENLADAREAGIDDGLVMEILVNTVMNIFTNYTNHIAETDIDFPAVLLAI